MNRRLRLGRDERGVSLVLVLVTLVVFGLIVPVLGQFGSTNGVSGYVLKGQRFDRYAAEAGMQGAIQWAQGQRQAGRQGTNCPNIKTGPIYGEFGPNSARTVTVECQGFDHNGLPEGTDRIPQYALLALGSGDAISLDGGGQLRTSGTWKSNGSIARGSVRVDASADYVGATDGCQDMNASPCDTAGSPVSQGSLDGDFTADVPPILSSVDRPRSMTNPCGAAVGDVLNVAPGLHWQADWFDAIGEGCGRRVSIHLLPGLHVFDFELYSGERNPLWDVDPSGSRTVDIVSDGCDDPSAQPVVFAGRFRLELRQGATADLCGAPARVPDQRVAIAQQIEDHPDPLGDSDPAFPSRFETDGDGLDFSVPPPGDPGLLAVADCPDLGTEITCPGALEGVLHGSGERAEITMVLPDPLENHLGARVDHLNFDIAHFEDDGDIVSGSVTIAGMPTGFECSDPPRSFDIVDAARWHTDHYVCDLSSADVPYFSAGDLRITYEVQLRNRRDQEDTPSARIGLDAVSVTANYADPVARQSRPESGTSIVQVDAGGAVHADGTVYLPSGDASIDFNGAATSTFGRGLVVNRIDASGFPNDPTFVPFALPNGGNYTDRLATFRAFLSDDTSDSTTAMLTARVRFCDPHVDGTVEQNVSSECNANGIAGGPAKILAWDPRR